MAGPVWAQAQQQDADQGCGGWLEAARRGMQYKHYRQLVELPLTAHQARLQLPGWHCSVWAAAYKSYLCM